MSETRPAVLLVDDDPRTLELLSSVLDAHGFEVTLSCSPDSAGRELRTRRFDAVVTDVVFDGFAEGGLVLSMAREYQRDVVVLLLTGYPLIEGAVSAIKQGAYDYLQKPVDPVHLAAFLHRALRERMIGRPSVGFADLAEILSQMVANTIERVDPYTAGHGERTRAYCRLLADEVGIDRTVRDRLELAAIAHDYGKIYLDDLTFLTNTGKLTAQEYREVQKHPALGALKLGAHPCLREVCRSISEHHEKFDGTGYPRRLRGDEISLSGRILGVVEVFDSLATKRSYKDEWELSQTIDFFRAQRSRAFDPDVLDAFLHLLEIHGEEWIRAPRSAIERARQEPPAAQAEKVDLASAARAR